jgi:hypothetical protein
VTGVKKATRKDHDAKRSGFGRHLRDYFRAAEDERREAGSTAESCNATQLAAWLTSRGHPATYKAVLAWAEDVSLPGSRYVALLEERLGAPWTFLDDRHRPPITRTERMKFLSLYAPTAAMRAHAVADLRELDERPRGRGE